MLMVDIGASGQKPLRQELVVILGRYDERRAWIIFAGIHIAPCAASSLAIFS